MRILKLKHFWFAIALGSTIVLFQNCGGSFKPVSNVTSSASFESVSDLERIEMGKTQYEQNCAMCHAAIHESSKLGRTRDQIIAAVFEIPQMNNLRSRLSDSDFELISLALIAESESLPTETDPEGRLQFQCTPGSVSRSPVLKLTNREFQNSLNSLLDGFSTSLKSDSRLNELYQALPNDRLLVGGSALKEQSQLVTQVSTNAFFETAFRAGQLVAQNQAGLTAYPGTNNCLSQTTVSQTCLRDFVRQLASRAFRRPVSSAEATTLANSFWSATLSKQDLVTLTFTSLAQSSDFLYRAYYRGNPEPSGSNLLRITNHELASKLSYFLTGGPPDAQLVALADSGQISDSQVLSAQVDRLLSTSGARSMVQRLFRESYGYDIFDQFSYSSDFLNGISTTGLQNAMISELDGFFTNLVIDQSSNFESLFTSRQTNITHAGLRSIYQTSTSGASTLSEERAGFLNRAAMLAKRSGYRASPIKRGLHVLEHVLCTEVGAPPPSAPTSLPPIEGGVVTTRENTERSSEVQGSSCVACHSRFNPLGYAFENFDTLGRVRQTERLFDSSGNFIVALPVNTAAVSSEIRSQPVSFNDSTELSTSLGSSDRAKLCFVKHLKNFESRVRPTAADNCQMNSALTTLYGDETGPGSIVDAVKSLVLSDEFRYWSY